MGDVVTAIAKNDHLCSCRRDRCVGTVNTVGKGAVGTFAIGQTTHIGFVLIQEDNIQTATTGDVVCSCTDEILIVPGSSIEVVIAVSINQYIIRTHAIQSVIARAAQ